MVAWINTAWQQQQQLVALFAYELVNNILMVCCCRIYDRPKTHHSIICSATIHIYTHTRAHMCIPFSFGSKWVPGGCVGGSVVKFSMAK